MNGQAGKTRSCYISQHSICISIHSSVLSSILFSDLFPKIRSNKAEPSLLLGNVPDDELAISTRSGYLCDFSITCPFISVDPSDTVLVNSQ
jgi:hypothetical protein